MLPVKRISCEGQSHYDVWMHCTQPLVLLDEPVGLRVSAEHLYGLRLRDGGWEFLLGLVLGLYHCIVCVSGLLST